MKLLLLWEELLATSGETVCDACVGLALLVAGGEVVEGAFVVVVEEEEALDEDEEVLLVQAAFDSNPKGLGTTGACSLAVPAKTLITEENTDFSLSPCPRVGRPSQAVESWGRPGRPPPSAFTGLHSAPTSVQVLAPVIVPASAKTLPSAPVLTSASVSVHTAVLASENIFPSGHALSAASVLSPVPRMAERLEGTAGTRGITASPIDSCWPWSAAQNTGNTKH